jgi:hypothetical protein
MCSQNLATEPCPETFESIPVLSISRQVLCHVSRSISTKCEPSLNAAVGTRRLLYDISKLNCWGRPPLNSLRMRAFCSGKVKPREQWHDVKYLAYLANVCFAKYNLIFMKFSIVCFRTNLCMESHCLSGFQRLFLTNIPTTYGASCPLALLLKN